MENVVFLSEIHPLMTNRFNPLSQARDWYNLFTHEECDALTDPSEFDFTRMIQLIASRVDEVGKTLVIRDWSHIDFIGFPFNDQPKFCLSLREAVENAGLTPLSVALVRNPADQINSMKTLTALSDDWDDRMVTTGLMRFAETIANFPIVQFESFLADPDTTLANMCGAWKIPFDPTYIQRWRENTNVTGDQTQQFSDSIAPKAAKPIPESVWHALSESPDTQRLYSALNYSLPSRYRPVFADSQTANSQSTASDDANATIVDCHQTLWRHPFDRNASLALIDALRRSGEHLQARLESERLLLQSPDDIEALGLAAELAGCAGDRFSAIPLRRRLLEYVPDDLENQFILANLLAGIGAVDESQSVYRGILDRSPENTNAVANFLLNLNYSDKHSATEIACEHFRLMSRLINNVYTKSNVASTNFTTVKTELSPIRIGYLSKDFIVHPVGKIMRGLLPHHDRTQFHVTCYHDGKKSDGLSSQIESASDQFIATHGWSDHQLSEQIKSDSIDILVDLGGFTAGGNRLNLFANRAAPLQIAFLGYPNTTAIPSIDYRITDRYADPPGVNEHLSAEKLVRLESGFLSWKPYDSIPPSGGAKQEPVSHEPVSHEPVSHEPVNCETLRIGSFNNLAKLSPSAIDCWASILTRTPNATLVLKYGDRFSSETVCNRIKRLFAERGVLADRLHFVRQAMTLKEHINLMQNVDLALDSFPYQGTMTTLECLSVGTPVISLCGNYYAHRATSAMMMRLDLHELVASDTEEYAELACQLLANPNSLYELRSNIRQRFWNSELVDTRRFVAEFETQLATLLQS